MTADGRDADPSCYWKLVYGSDANDRSAQSKSRLQDRGAVAAFYESCRCIGSLAHRSREGLVSSSFDSHPGAGERPLTAEDQSLDQRIANFRNGS